MTTFTAANQAINFATLFSVFVPAHPDDYIPGFSSQRAGGFLWGNADTNSGVGVSGIGFTYTNIDIYTVAASGTVTSMTASHAGALDFAISNTSVVVDFTTFYTFSPTQADPYATTVHIPNDALISLFFSGNDNISGSTLGDTLSGGAGNDTMDGGGGDDIVDGGTGNNLLYGGDGNDLVSGGVGNDVLVLGNGNDSGYAGNGNNYIYAGAGNDLLVGGTGLDVLLGEDGNDSIYGGAGFNYLFGGAGNDILIGSGGTSGSDVNVMFGGDGADYLYGGAGTNYFYGGAGDDTMYGGSGLNIFISSGETDGDVIYGGSGQNYVYGSNAGDTVTGGSGVDVFLMGFGNDVINGGGGVDYVWGSGGSDTFVITDAASETMVIEDFNTGGAKDLLNFAATSLHSFADVQAASFYSAGINTTIITDAAGNAAWLIGVAPAQLDASMFKFT